jgi:hypothetical protein
VVELLPLLHLAVPQLAVMPVRQRRRPRRRKRVRHRSTPTLVILKLTTAQRRRNPTTTWDSGFSTKRILPLFSILHASLASAGVMSLYFIT